MSVFVTGDKHGKVVTAFSYRKHPRLRELTSDDVIVVCGDVGLGWNGPDKQYEYELEFLSKKPFSIVFVRGNHDNTNVIRNYAKPSCGDGKTVKLIAGTLSNPFYGDKIYDNIYWVSDSAVVDLCGHRSLMISGASSHDIDNLVVPEEKDRMRGLRKEREFYRVVGKSWWPDENINIPYAFSLIDYYAHDFCGVNKYTYLRNMPFRRGGKKRICNFDFVFTHDCPAYMCDLIVKGNEPYRIHPTENEDFLELIKDHINYRWMIHGHMHLFCRYFTNVDEYGKHEIVCLYNHMFRLPDSNDEDFTQWDLIYS